MFVGIGATSCLAAQCCRSPPAAATAGPRVSSRIAVVRRQGSPSRRSPSSTNQQPMAPPFGRKAAAAGLLITTVRCCSWWRHGPRPGSLAEHGVADQQQWSCDARMRHGTSFRGVQSADRKPSPLRPARVHDLRQSRTALAQRPITEMPAGRARRLNPGGWRLWLERPRSISTPRALTSRRSSPASS